MRLSHRPGHAPAMPAGGIGQLHDGPEKSKRCVASNQPASHPGKEMKTPPSPARLPAVCRPVALASGAGPCGAGHFFTMRTLLPLFVSFVCFAGQLGSAAPAKKTDAAAPSPWAEWVEKDFPFFSSILDARQAGAGFPTNNLTPRGLVLNLGHDLWACFDTDLLRVAAIWQGKGVSPNALAPKSYHLSGGKTPGGQFPAPQPEGKVWLANGIYPGWQVGDELSLTDPREPAPSPHEVGRGPLPEEMGRMGDVQYTSDGPVFGYTVKWGQVREWWRASLREGTPVIERHVRVSGCPQPLQLLVGDSNCEVSIGYPPDGLGYSRSDRATLSKAGSSWLVRVPARKGQALFCLTYVASGTAPTVSAGPIPWKQVEPRWPQEVTTTVKLSAAKDAYVVDHIELPHKNPWRRNVRPADIQFLQDGTGVLVTLDGDVWLARGLHDAGGTVRWRRFASGLHEPMTCAIRDGQIYVFDRNGIWRLRDTNGDGEADVHELFSNAFAQTADMREFPSQIRLAPGGEFIIAKGGQQAATLGKHNGSVLRVSADGRRATVLGYGFRQPNIGVNPRTGLVTSSDQEGQYIPTTPLHIVRDGQFYGYLAEGLQPREKYPAPIAEPLTWMPHAVNASAISQVWLHDAKLGALNDSMVQICFNKPELLRVLFNNRTAKPQAAVVSVARAFEFPPLNGSVNPADGQLYIAGFQVVGWGNSLNTLAGLGRVRYTGAPVTLPREVVPMDQGVLLRFDMPLDAKTATNPDSYSLSTWGYVRTYKYGSPQLKADGAPGVDWLAASSAYLSRDGRGVFIGVPGMKPVMQLRVGWSLATADGRKFEENAYTTPYELAKFDPRAEGFGDITVDLTPRAALAQAGGPVTIEEGQRLYQLFGCVACHSADGVDVAKVGPTWLGLFGTERPVVVNKKKANVRVDEAYVRESILDPLAKVVAGYEKGEYAMPSYAGVVNDSQIEALVLYLKSLKDAKPAAATKPVVNAEEFQ
jgi:glucose/arabinose dehydrogenase/mono/diheme cytochrome c family protein